MRYLTDFADQAVMLPVVLAIAISLLLQGWRRGAAIWLCVVAATFATMLALKIATLACPPVFGPIDIHSPSGHVAAATIVAGGLTALLTRRQNTILLVALLAALVVSASRLFLGLHSVPEVAVGALVGLAGAAALLALAGPPPPLRPGRVFAIVLLVAVIFHGLHLPAEAAIRHTAFRAARLLSMCRPVGTLPHAAPRWTQSG